MAVTGGWIVAVLYLAVAPPDKWIGGFGRWLRLQREIAANPPPLPGDLFASLGPDWRFIILHSLLGAMVIWGLFLRVREQE